MDILDRQASDNLYLKDYIRHIRDNKTKPFFLATEKKRTNMFFNTYCVEPVLMDDYNTEDPKYYDYNIYDYNILLGKVVYITTLSYDVFIKYFYKFRPGGKSRGGKRKTRKQKKSRKNNKSKNTKTSKKR